MRKGTGIAGATLLFDPRNGPPDLVLAMQYLIDDLRGEGRRIAAIKLTPSTLRLRADPFELLLTVAQGPIPATAMQGLLRPPVGDRPDFARVHMARTLRLHQQAMGFLVRRRGAPIPDLEDAMRSLAREGQLALCAVIEAAHPALLIWQPGSLVLTPDEFRHADVGFLLTPGDPDVPLSVPPPARLALPRPDTGFDTGLDPGLDPGLGGMQASGVTLVAIQDPGNPPVAQGSRATRQDKRSVGRLFGTNPERPPVLARIDRATERVSHALRDPGPEPKHHDPGRKAALWAALLPFVGMGGA